MQRSHHHFRRPQYHVNTCHRQVVSLSECTKGIVVRQMMSIVLVLMLMVVTLMVLVMVMSVMMTVVARYVDGFDGSFGRNLVTS